jgi:hypothetical protein
MRKLILFGLMIGMAVISKGDSWTQKADFGGAVRYGAVGFSIGTKGYVGTGQDTVNTVHFNFKRLAIYSPNKIGAVGTAISS